MTLPLGLYDQLLTEALWQTLSRTTDADSRLLDSLTAQDAPACLTDALALQLKKILEDMQGEGKEKLLGQLHLVNSLLVSLRQRLEPEAAAVGWLTPNKRAPFQAGVLALQDRKVELLFVTLDKSEGYHAQIAYHDYAISADLFHW